MGCGAFRPARTVSARCGWNLAVEPFEDKHWDNHPYDLENILKIELSIYICACAIYICIYIYIWYVYIFLLKKFRNS